MRRSETVYLQHILDAIGRIESYIGGLDEGQFAKTPLVQDAVIRRLEIIGEAAKRVSDGTRQMAADVPGRISLG